MPGIKKRFAVVVVCAVIVLTVLAVGIGIAEAGGCRVRVRSSGDQILLVPSYANQGYAFQVGADLQLRAIVQQEVARLLGQLGQQPQPENEPDRPWQPPADPTPTANMLSQKCAKCHDGTNPDRVQLVGVELSCEQRIEAIRRLLIEPGNPEHMPKGGQLTAEELGDLIGELSGAK